MRHFCVFSAISMLLVVWLPGAWAYAAGVPGFTVSYSAEGGSEEVFLQAKLDGRPVAEGSLSAEQFDGRNVRQLLACDLERGRRAVLVRLAVPDGRHIDYPASTRLRCGTYPISYAIAGWQLVVGGTASDTVRPPHIT